jgi:NAD(P)-dependent dehydrogenase (short-subunit alcohol dehydrogenase family)
MEDHMDTGLEHRSVLVTGGTRGIGKAVALAYAANGARTVVSYANDPAAADEVVEDIDSMGASGLTVRLDLADMDSIRAAVSSTVERFGGLDVLVANAVRWPVDARGPLADSDPDTWERALHINIDGTAATVRAAMPHLATSSAGRLVLISSGVSRHGMAGATAYAAAKAALDGLVAALKWEAGEHGVLVNIVSPGFTVTENNLANFPEETRESVRQRTPSRRLSVPGDIAAAVLFLGSPLNGNITGAYLPVAGGID